MNRLLKGIITLGSIFLLTSCGELTATQVEERCKNYNEAAAHEKYAAVKMSQTTQIKEHFGLYEDVSNMGISNEPHVEYVTEFSVMSIDKIQEVESLMKENPVKEAGDAQIKWEAHGEKGLKCSSSATIDQSSNELYNSLVMDAYLLINDEGLFESSVVSLIMVTQYYIEYNGHKITQDSKLSYVMTTTYEYLTKAEYDTVTSK